MAKKNVQGAAAMADQDRQGAGDGNAGAPDVSARPERNRKERAEEILHTLRGRIANHELPPGTRLQEVELAEEFDVSRAAVREILGALEQRGLVNRVPNRGAVVARLEIEEIYEIFDVREALEGLCVRLATQNAPPETWDPFLERFGDEMAEAIAKGEVEPYIDTLEDLRRETVRWAGNSHATHFLDLLLEKTHLIKLRVMLLPGRAAAGREMHVEMLRHMRAGDAAAAEAAKKRIIRSARDWLERYRSFVM
ncbi:MAG: GntR family transcriptional regulator [Paracoccaceae bacterium]|jgi:DNA-binding GntR family transcriptional regulator|nr:GntR family transcriptional regulator [Paracoccaceae bacterium]